jgi:hypothetical protein
MLKSSFARSGVSPFRRMSSYSCFWVGRSAAADEDGAGAVTPGATATGADARFDPEHALPDTTAATRTTAMATAIKGFRIALPFRSGDGESQLISSTRPPKIGGIIHPYLLTAIACISK